MYEIFITFLRIGLIGFGGAIALVSLIEQEICHNRRWLNVDKFAEIFAICKLLPGPLAVQVAICCGFHRKGRLGGFLAGVAFLLPALILIIILGILYTHNLNTQSKVIIDLFKFMQDATLAIILITTWDLGKAYIKNFTAFLIMLFATGLIFLHPGLEPLAILAFGFIGLSCYKLKGRDLQQFPLLIVASAPKLAFAVKTDLVYSKLLQLFWICIKAGEFSFGTGLAILPLLHGDLVSNLHWLSNKQFIDGVTLGQITPGPTTVSIVFFGFLSAGIPGLLVSTLGFYIPPLFNSLVLIPIFWQRLTSSPYLRIFTMWAFPAVIGGILSATLKIGLSAVTSYIDITLIIVALILILKKILPVWAIIPLYGIIGLLFGYFI